MKIDARVRWTFDSPEVGITNGTEILVPVDADYVEPEARDISEYVSNELSERYGMSLFENYRDNDGGHFSILNIDNIIVDINEWEK